MKSPMQKIYEAPRWELRKWKGVAFRQGMFALSKVLYYEIQKRESIEGDSEWLRYSAHQDGLVEGYCHRAEE